jgi:RNA ligase (TIGR02306 family)
MNSTHRVEVVPLTLEKHPNADKLSIVKIGDYTVCTQTDQWAGKDVAAYILPDSLVDTRRPEFQFLTLEAKHYEDGHTAKSILRKERPYFYKVGAKNFRKVLSYGLLVPAPEGVKPGDDVAEQLGVKHWNEPEPTTSGGEVAKPPKLATKVYDVEAFLKHGRGVFVQDEPVIVTEKIHGCNGRWVFHNGEFYCGSKTEWKKEFATPPDGDKIETEMRAKLKDKVSETELEEKVIKMRSGLENRRSAQNLWWKALRATPTLTEWLQTHPDHVVYGEVYGAVQDMKYGVPPGEVRIAVFDILKDGDWMSVMEAHKLAAMLPWVPVIGALTFDFDYIAELAKANEQSLIPGADHPREGIVVKTTTERRDPTIGRVQLKAVSEWYAGRK